MIKKNHILPLLIGIVMAFSQQLSAQTETVAMETSPADSLSLDSIISRVVSSYPSVKEAEEAIKRADTQIELARSGHYPNVSANASYSHIGPVTKFSIPGMGEIQMNPSDNYSATIDVSQSISDFGKTAANIAFQQESKQLGKQTLEQVKQQLSIRAVHTYYSLLFLQEAIDIKNEQLANLQRHLDFINKKMETGSATQYEALSTKVKISGVKSQKLDILASIRIQQAVLNTLLGEPETKRHFVKEKLTVDHPQHLVADTMINMAVRNRDEMKIAREKTRLAELNLNLIKSKNTPNLRAFVSAGAKDGYIPSLYQLKPNYAVGLDLHIPIFDANRNKNQQLLAKSGIQSSVYETERMQREVASDVIKSSANVETAAHKVQQFKLQLKQARDAFSLAETSFKAGSITNLDLLDATTAVSNSRLLLLKSEIDYALSIYDLQASIGDRMYE
ncbi:TolC family protein [Prolixibacter denitrificans]|uniref:Outer membrane protein n=1 Tax=Prolixibacter denitrificans TaxID=1541063 RepID=A0A2P8C7F3_9BACT|nr:TolC family protein [Prolixibacter denitrificans]PSK80899.1 outer membrane protein TolC [Prolixibacter denitrificans]GET22303.1 outer membrane protein [Prolixibacter denitrificans]